MDDLLFGWVGDILDPLLEDVPVLETQEGSLLLHLLRYNSRVYFR